MRRKRELESVSEHNRFKVALRRSVMVKEAVGKNKSGVWRY